MGTFMGTSRQTDALVRDILLYYRRQGAKKVRKAIALHPMQAQAAYFACAQ